MERKATILYTMVMPKKAPVCQRGEGPYAVLAIIITSLVSIRRRAIVLLHFFPERPDSSSHYDFALVLGCPCLSDGSLSRMQGQRMDHALWLYEQCLFLLIVSGGRKKRTRKPMPCSPMPGQHAIHAEAETRATNT
ncbi:MAG: hypothetical protein ACLVJ6_17125 [Merdibacter sp.]